MENGRSRPEFREEAHGRFSGTLSRIEGILGQELLDRAEIKNGAAGFNREDETYHEVGIWEGSFQELGDVLEHFAGGGTGDQLDVMVVEIYRDIEIFTISRRSSRPPEPITIYMGVTDHHMLALAHNLKSVKQVIDQQLNTGSPPDPFFGGLQSLVRGSEVPVEIETYRGAVIYQLPSSTTFYVAVVDQSILVLSFSVEKIKETIDRIRDGGEIPAIVREAMGDLGQTDFLYAVPFSPSDQGDTANPFGDMIHRSSAISYNDDAMSTVWTRLSFEGPEQAAAAVEWMEAQGYDGGVFFGSNDPVGQMSLEGTVILSEAVVPDRDVISLLF